MEPATSTTNGKPKQRNRKAAERFAILNSFVDGPMQELSRAEITTWLALYRDTWDGIAEASQSHIARRTGSADRTVRRALGSLVRRGLVKVVYRGGLNRGASKYRLLRTPTS
jgi:hypothetical protein